MAEKSKTREITIVDDGGRFNAIMRRFSGSETKYDFDSIGLLRKLLSNEKARLMHVIKTRNPGSIYALAKLLKRDFKSVSEDIKLLERFGFIEMVAEKTGKRERLKPVLSVESMYIHFKL